MELKSAEPMSAPDGPGGAEGRALGATMAGMAKTEEPTPNAWEAAYWNGPAAERWVRYQPQFDRAFEPFTRSMIESAALRSGEHALDVGCGCGTTTLAASRRVGPDGSATGLDVSEPMLARARTRADAVPNVRFVCGDAGTCGFDRRFDVCVSQFGVMFFPDPVSAFRHLRQALRPGGRIAFVCWRRMDENPWVTIPFEAVLKAAKREPDPSVPVGPGPFAFGEVGRIEGVLADAGFTAIDVRAFDADVLLSPIGLDEAVAFSAHAGPAGRLLTEASQEERIAGIHAIADSLVRHAGGGQVHLGGAIWVATARAP
jgi:SAM-dependent methyltransferase